MFFSTFAPVSNLAAYNLPPILLSKLIFSTCCSRDVWRLEICLSCGVLVKEGDSVDGVSEVILISSFKIFFVKNLLLFILALGYLLRGVVLMVWYKTVNFQWVVMEFFFQYYSILCVVCQKHYYLKKIFHHINKTWLVCWC